MRSKKERTSVLGLEELSKLLSSDEKRRRTVEALRHELPRLSPSERWGRIDSLPTICPGQTVRRQRDGSVRVSYNGVVLLEVPDLASSTDADEVKARVAGWPTTLAAMYGASGRSVKVLVGGTLDDGTLPSDTEAIQRFHEQLYTVCAEVYATVARHPLKIKTARPEDVFRWTFDQTPFVNTDAMPVKVSRRDVMRESAPSFSNAYGITSVQPSAEVFSLYRRRFALAMKQAQALQQETVSAFDNASKTNAEQQAALESLLNATALEAMRLGIPQEETVRQAGLNQRFLELDPSLLRAIVESTFLENAKECQPRSKPTMQEITLHLQAFMETRYDLRFNELLNGVEWRFNNSTSFGFQPLDPRVLNAMIQACHENGLEVSDRDMKRYLGSTRIRNFNVMQAYLEQHRRQWDGHTDHIDNLASRVPCSNPHWRKLFHTWFLGMVAQWDGWNATSNNTITPLLIGASGCGASTYGQIILPPELREVGFRELVDSPSKPETRVLLANALLISLDALDKKSEKARQIILKNLITESNVKGRRPYSSSLVSLPRLASFIATADNFDLLAEPTAARRFFVADIPSGQCIDVQPPIDYGAMYDQALSELNSGRRHYFTPEEAALIEAFNARFSERRPEVLRFLDVFEPALERGSDTRAMKVSELVAEVRHQTGFNYTDKAFHYLGHWLSMESRASRIRRTMHNGSPVYLVRKRTS